MYQPAKNIFFFLLLVLPLGAMAQPLRMEYRDRLGDSVQLVDIAVEPPRERRPPYLRGSLSAGILLSTNGYGIVINKGYLRDGAEFGSINRNRFFQVRLFELEISEVKSPKEKKANTAVPGLPFQSGAYILGKINNFYQIKLGYGRRQLIAGKPDPGTIAIHWVYLGGFSAGLLKPYYLNLYQKGPVKYSKDIQREFISPGMIVGKAPFSKGFEEIEFVPGVYVKTGLNFDFAGSRKSVMALEVGLSGTYYTKKIPQMVFQDEKQFFLNFYAILRFGKRW